ncbi:MAG: hypothetical protein R2713_01280 [Ilumatobacteraceae bacterium]
MMLDGELGGDVVDACCVQPVSITNVELCLSGDDLIVEPDLRRGLVAVARRGRHGRHRRRRALHPSATGSAIRATRSLAELMAGGEHYVVRAFRLPNERGSCASRADRPNRWDV